MLTFFTTTCKTPKNLFSCFSAVFVCFGNTINMLKIASNKLKQWGKFHYRTMERFIAGKGWSRQRGVEGRWRVGAGLTAILTTIEMEKKMNEMCSPWWRWGRRRRRPDSRPLACMLQSCPSPTPYHSYLRPAASAAIVVAVNATVKLSFCLTSPPSPAASMCCCSAGYLH